MHIIAFSGSSRTGKSTAIQTMKELFEKQGKRVKIFGETAQIYIDNHPGPIEDRYAFEHFIMDEEIKRLYEMQEIKTTQQYDIALADRTFLDAFVYIYRAIIHGHIKNPDLLAHAKELAFSKELYDVVVFFDTMIRPDENFAVMVYPDDRYCFVILSLFILRHLFPAQISQKKSLIPTDRSYRPAGRESRETIAYPENPEVLRQDQAHIIH